MWPCEDNRTCIEAGDVCNGKRECPDKSDEHNQLCGCGDDEWPCKDGDGCFKENLVCDGMAHCNDKSDESPEHCLGWICPRDMRKCRDGQQCISIQTICDASTDCRDTSDEHQCSDYTCPGGATKCSDNLQCINETLICDGEIDCKDGSDELCTASCLKKPLTEKSIVRRCIGDSTTCVPVHRFCDGIADCLLGSDEGDCSCSDWSLHSCTMKNIEFCTDKRWLDGNHLADCKWKWSNSSIQINVISSGKVFNYSIHNCADCYI